MAVTYVAGTSAVAPSNITTLTINKPTGAAENDILIAIVGTVDETVTNPSGWTTLETTTNGGAALGHLAYKVLGASEGSSYGFGISQNQNDVAGSIVCFRGIDTAGAVRDSAAGTSATSPSLTGTQSTDMVTILACGRPNGNTPTNNISAPGSPWTAATGAHSGASGAGGSGFPQSTDVAYQTNGATGTFTATSTTNYVTFAVSLIQGSSSPINHQEDAADTLALTDTAASALNKTTTESDTSALTDDATPAMQYVQNVSDLTNTEDTAHRTSSGIPYLKYTTYTIQRGG